MHCASLSSVIEWQVERAGAEGLGDITCRDGVPEIRASTKGESDRSQGLNGERQMQKGTPRTHAGGGACP